MHELIKAIFEEDKFPRQLVRAMAIKPEKFSDVYYELKQMTNMPYDCDLKFPYDIIDGIRREFNSRPCCIVIDDSIKTAKKYRLVGSIYGKGFDNALIKFLFRHHRFNIKTVKPFPDEYDMDWLRRAEGYKNAMTGANQWVAWGGEWGVLVAQSDYKWWSMMKFKAKYAPQIRAELDRLNLRYDLVVDNEL